MLAIVVAIAILVVGFVALVFLAGAQRRQERAGASLLLSADPRVDQLEDEKKKFEEKEAGK